MSKANNLTNACVVSTLLCLLVLTAMPSTAAVLMTNEEEYTQTNSIMFTFMNDGLSQIHTIAYPPLGIRHLETGEWILPYGLEPSVIDFGPSDSLTFIYDTGYLGIDPAGRYRASIQYMDGSTLYTAYANYLLQEGVPVTSTTLDQVKCLFR